LRPLLSIAPLVFLAAIAPVPGAWAQHGSAASLPTAGRPGLAPVSPGTGAGSGSRRDRVRKALTRGEGAGKSWCSDQGGYTLGAHYDNVYACGPATGTPDDFDTMGFQCVELSARFLWVVYHDFVANIPDGKDLVHLAGAALGIPIGTPGPGSLPAPGDVVSMWGGPAADVYGHTAVVTAVQVDASGNGTITIMEQNAINTGWDQLDVSHWAETYGDPNYAGGLYYYTHVRWLELAASQGPPTHSGTEQYDVRGLGRGTQLSALNGSGQAAGAIQWKTRTGLRMQRSFVYRAGRRTALGVPTTHVAATAGMGINGHGMVAASATATGGATRAYAVNSWGTPAWWRLPLPASHVLDAAATSIDEHGDLSGWMRVPAGREGVVWIHGHGGYRTRILHANRGFREPLLAAADHWGDAVGTELSSAGRTVATVWSPWGQAFPLPGLTSNAASIASGMQVRWSGGRRLLEIVGASQSASGSLEACRWQVTVRHHWLDWSNAQPLGIPTGYRSSLAIGLNANGWIVGNLLRPDGGQRAFLWEPSQGMVPMSSLISATSGWVITAARSVNDAGQIAGEGYNRGWANSGAEAGVILTPEKRPQHSVSSAS